MKSKVLIGPGVILTYKHPGNSFLLLSVVNQFWTHMKCKILIGPT